jgi:PKD repeat protein
MVLKFYLLSCGINLKINKMFLFSFLKPFLLFSLITFSLITFSQEEKFFCGQIEASEKIKLHAPKVWEQMEKEDKYLEEFIRINIDSKNNRQKYIVPVVFHIIHNYGPENISNEQVHDAMRILNLDFQKLNADTALVKDEFKSIIGNANFEFRLAQKAPDGSCTNGIIRVASLETYVGANYSNNSSTSSLSRWPREKYLNIWVVNSMEDGVAGYTYRPPNASYNLDGIMMRYDYTGSIGTGTLGRSRILTHEVGHWINLAHTWGNSNTPQDPNNCTGDDGVDDTPNTIGWRSCNLNGESCGSLDNVENYMDYAYCYKMFTAGQAARMRTAMQSTVAQRNNLWTTTNLNATGTNDPYTPVLCKAEFSSDRTEVCVGQSINFEENSFNSPTSWQWSFSGGNPSSSNLKNPSVSYSTPGVYNVSLTVGNGSDTKTETKNDYIVVLPSLGRPSEIIEGFENASLIPNNEWSVFNPDNGITWDITSLAAASGGKSIRINNFSNPTGRIDELLTTTMDLSGYSAVHVSFKVAHAQKATTNTDNLRVFVSNNCGQSWAIRWSRAGSNLATAPLQTTTYVPTASQWTEYTLTSIPSSNLVNDFRLKFQFTSGGGNNIYIDDINIFDPAQVGIKDITSRKGFSIFPNPATNNTTILFNLNKTENISISMIDVLGKSISFLSNRNFEAGEHRVPLNVFEGNFAKGIYFVRITIGENTFIEKLIVQ